MRIGLGFDVHAFAPGRPLVLGGITIPCELGLLGHSDADVVTHAVMDALLGALSLGDIGQHFPDTEERWRGASSIGMLRHVVELVGARGYRIGNVDVVVLAERPRLAPHKAAMAQSLAGAMGIGEADVSVKATTMESMGFVGRQEGMAAQAIALLLPASPGWRPA